MLVRNEVQAPPIALGTDARLGPPEEREHACQILARLHDLAAAGRAALAGQERTTGGIA